MSVTILIYSFGGSEIIRAVANASKWVTLFTSKLDLRVFEISFDYNKIGLMILETESGECKQVCNNLMKTLRF